MNIVLKRACFCETLILLRKPEEVNLLQASSSNDNECDRECRICWYTMYISFWYNIIQLSPPLKVNIIIVHPRGVVFPRALARGRKTSQGWTIMMFTASAGNKPEGKQHPKGEQLWCSPQVRAIIVLLYRNSIYNNVGCNKHLFVCFYLVFS
jgi:hypothetical protein